MAKCTMEFQMFKGKNCSKTTYYRRMRKAKALGCDFDNVPDNRGRHGNHASNSEHYRWQNGRLNQSHGYVLIRVGVGHPLADDNGYALEHHVVAVSAGIKIGDGDVVHHINGDKKDNRIENLKIMTNSEHSKYHRMIERIKRNHTLDGVVHEEMPR